MNQTHTILDCGVELAVLHLPDRRAEALDIRMLTGMVNEPADKLGLARLVEETLDKGTESYDGRALSDAFDKIGAVTNSGCGRETSAFTSLCLPEFFDRNVELHAEFLRRPTFPEESCTVAVELARQDLLTLEDDAQGLTDKLITRQALGPLLGRHGTGERETLATITRDDLLNYWRTHYRANRMLVSAAGPLEPAAVAEVIERWFADFGPPQRPDWPEIPVEFTPGTLHQSKATEQEQIAIAMMGAGVTSEDYPAERLLLGVLAGGMSARLFTEVREKQGLVYWVGAWHERPRGSGVIFFGASTTPQRCDKTYDTLLREIDRVGHDIAEEEIERALAGITVRADIRADITRSRCSEQADDVIHYGRPIPWEEKRARLESVTVEDIKRFHGTYVADSPRCVVTLGPRALGEESDQTAAEPAEPEGTKRP